MHRPHVADDCGCSGPSGPIPARAARVLAHYLPQFHPIPENDAWWGAGFTEWTNVVKARPLFAGHYQPHLPAELGFYDLRVPETRIAQSEMARASGIEGFIYWHYWFAGKRLLERPFREVLESGEPDYPFCLAWGNHDWTGIWGGQPDRVLQLQTYPGPADDEAHFYALLPAFQDARYVRVEGRPLFFVLQPESMPEPRRFTDLWRELAAKEGLGDLHLVAYAWERWRGDWDPRPFGYDAMTYGHQATLRRFSDRRSKRARRIRRLRGRPRHLYTYEEALPHLLFRSDFPWLEHPTVLSNWDTSPRLGMGGVILHDATPELFRTHLRQALARIASQPPERRILFLKSWNEWAEGNHIEPDQRYGRGYLEVIREELQR